MFKVLRVSNAWAARVASVIFFILSILFCFVFTPQWVPATVSFGPSPQLVPNITWILIGFTSICLFISSGREIDKAKKSLPNPNGIPASSGDISAEESESLLKDDENEDALEKIKEYVLENDTEYCEFDFNGMIYVLAAIISVLAYLFFVRYTTFIPMVFVIVFTLMLLYGQRRKWCLLVIPAVMSFGLYYFFNQLLKMVLP